MLPFIFLAHPITETVKKFFGGAWHGVTDYGACCLITPHLNFVNPETKDMTPEKYEPHHWTIQIPKGARNNQIGGIKVLLDVESFDISYSGKESLGFRIAFTDQTDTAMMKQDGFLISPG